MAENCLPELTSIGAGSPTPQRMMFSVTELKVTIVLLGGSVAKSCLTVMMDLPDMHSKIRSLNKMFLPLSIFSYEFIPKILVPNISAT